MDFLRKMTTLTNEISLCVGLLLLSGHFGIRGEGGFLPAFTVLGVALYAVYCYIQISSQSEDSYSEESNWYDKHLPFVTCMVVSVALIVGIGTKI
jgi:hypothetical protein